LCWRPINRVDPTGLIRTPGEIYDDAQQAAWDSNLPDPHNGLQDAFRHCAASCMAANEYGEALAEAFGDANEVRGDLTHNQPLCERQMDVDNNRSGREASRAAPDDASCIAECYQAAASGELEVLNSSSTGYWGY
jgi:hypothetical protein